jgi:hypothetical protein
MGLSGHAVNVSIEVANRDARRTVEATQLLSNQLARAGRVHVRQEKAAAPPGVKSAGAFVVGWLVVSGVLSRETIRELVRLATAFVQRGAARKVILEQGGDKLILEAAPVDTQKALADAWIERRLKSPADPEDLGKPSARREGKEG